MFRAFCLTLFLLYVNMAMGQQPIFQWAAQFGSSVTSDTWNDNGRTVAVDEQGNVYSAGVFFHEVDFDPGAGTFTMVAQGPFNEAIYISKLSPAGQFIWAKQIPAEISGPIYLTVDRHANIYLTAYISGSTDMDPGPGVYTAQPIGPQDAFLLKLDSDGNFLWEKQFGSVGANNGAAGYAIDVDQNDNVIFTGSFYGTVDVDPGSATYTFTSASNAETFLVKLSPDGDFIWGKHLGSFQGLKSSVDAQDLKCDGAGNVFVTGTYSGTCNFDPAVSNYSLQQGGGFICKYSSSGSFLWAKQIGAYSTYYVVHPVGIDVDPAGNVYTSGSFYGTEDFDPGNPVYNLTSNGSMDAFILKLTAQGNFVWAKNFGASNPDYGYDVATDPLGNVYMIGLYSGTVDFDPGPASHSICCLYDGTVILKLDSDGNFMFAPAFNRPLGSSSGTCTGRRIVADRLQNIYMAGSFGGSVEFDPGKGVYILTEGRGWSDAFVVKLAKCTNITTSTLNITSCGSYVLNNHNYDTSGTYMQVIPNKAGCDSVLTLNLTINKRFTTQTKTICQGQTFYAAGSNQTSAGIYVDTLHTATGCDSVVTTHLVVNSNPVPNLGIDKFLCAGDSLILTPGTFARYTWQDGSTHDKFPIAKGGSYWVTVMNNDNCAASDTINIKAIQPPTSFLRHIDSLCPYEDLTLKSSQTFTSYLWSTGETQPNISVKTPGIYWLKVTDQNSCVGKDSISVVPKQCMEGVFVPTAFSPNRDGKNDYFRPLIFGKLLKYEFTIYNRWGHLIFKTTETNKSWDGRLAGVLQDPAVYIWTCTYQLNGRPVTFKNGTVTLIR